MTVAARLRGIVLTLGGIVGGLCLLAWTGSILFGIKPLVFTSGSMSPTIPAGSIAFAKSVPADHLSAGDIVSVLTKDGARVTHRVVTVNGAGAMRILVLKGDANRTPDAQTYPVSSADRVLWSVPCIGYPVSFLGSPIGLFLLGACAVGVLVLGFRPGRRAEGPPGSDSGSGLGAGQGRQVPGGQVPGGHRRGTVSRGRAVMAALPVTLAALAATATPTTAAFTDSAVVTSGTMTADTVARPTSVACANTDPDGVLVLLGYKSITITAPVQDARYSYLLRIFNSSGAQVGSDHLMTTAGSSAGYKVTKSDISSLLTLGGTFYVRVYARLSAATSWESAQYRSYSFTMTGVLNAIVYFNCGSAQ